MSSTEARRCNSVLAKGRYIYNRKKVLSQRLLISLKGENYSYTLLAVQLCLPCRQDLPVCTAPWFTATEAFLGRRFCSPSTLILHWFEVTVAFVPLFRTAGNPSPGLPVRAAGQWGEHGEAANGKRWYMNYTALCQWQPGQVTEDLLRLCVKKQWLPSPGQRSNPDIQQGPHPGACSPFLLLLSGSRCTKPHFCPPRS